MLSTAKIRDWSTLLFIVAATVIALRCSSGVQSATPNEHDQIDRADQQDYEKTFRPSEYDPSVEEIIRELLSAASPSRDSAAAPTEAVTDTLRGFRVQVLSTSDIEEANYIRDSVSVMLPSDWVYVVYQTPYYKVRVGDFISRTEAGKMSSYLQGNGFADAWIVPDLVLSPPPRKEPPPSPVEQPDQKLNEKAD